MCLVKEQPHFCNELEGGMEPKTCIDHTVPLLCPALRRLTPTMDCLSSFPGPSDGKGRREAVMIYDATVTAPYLYCWLCEWRSQRSDGRRFRTVLITFSGSYNFSCHCVISILHSASSALLGLRVIQGRTKKIRSDLFQRYIVSFQLLDRFVLAIYPAHFQQYRGACSLSTSAPPFT